MVLSGLAGPPGALEGDMRFRCMAWRIAMHVVWLTLSRHLIYAEELPEPVGWPPIAGCVPAGVPDVASASAGVSEGLALL
eukprot:2777916-Pyramimonas_sp.AAC.1